jgi:hypothetical protein
VNDKIEPSISIMHRRVQESVRDLKSYRSKTRESPSGFIHAMKNSAMISMLSIRSGLCMIAWLGWWATVLFMSIWCSGNSAAALELIIYSVIAGFLSWWIVFLKVTNVPLMDRPENVWTFGASLIVFLFLLLLFHTLDVWAGVKRDAHLMRRKKQDEEAQQAVQPSDYSANNDFASGVKEITDQPMVSQASGDNQPGAPVMNKDDWTSKEKT